MNSEEKRPLTKVLYNSLERLCDFAEYGGGHPDDKAAAKIVRKEFNLTGYKSASITARLDEIAGELEAVDPRIALALDQVSDKLAAFDEKNIAGWSKVQDSIFKAIEEVNKMHMQSGPEDKKTVNSIYGLLQQAQKECKKQFKSAAE